MNYNEDGYTLDEIEMLIACLNDPHQRFDDIFTERRTELAVEALQFYREKLYT